MATRATHFPSANAITDDPLYTDSGVGKGDVGVPGRTLPYGAVRGQNVRQATRFSVVVAAGAPGTTTTDLSAQRTLEGVLPLAVGCTLITYIEWFRTNGSDARFRLSAANPVALLSGTTDTSTMGRHGVIDESLPDSVAPAAASSVGFVFDATHKNITVESTAGCTVEFYVEMI